MKRNFVIFVIGIAAITTTGCDRSPSKEQPSGAGAGASAGQPASAPSSGTVQWIDPKTIQEGPIQHDTLSGEQLDRIKAVHDAFAEVDPESIEKWTDDFKRDLDIERELAIWEHMAKAYQPFVASHNLSAAAKKEAFQVILMRSMTSEDDALAHLNLKVLSRDDAVQLMRGY